MVYFIHCIFTNTVRLLLLPSFMVTFYNSTKVQMWLTVWYSSWNSSNRYITPSKHHLHQSSVAVASFLPGRAKDLSATPVIAKNSCVIFFNTFFKCKRYTGQVGPALPPLSFQSGGVTFRIPTRRPAGLKARCSSGAINCLWRLPWTYFTNGRSLSSIRRHIFWVDERS
jgi:hypothetical protein